MKAALAKFELGFRCYATALIKPKLSSYMSHRLNLPTTFQRSFATTTSTMSAVPLLLCGKFTGHVAAVSEAVKPEFEIAHHSPSTADAIACLSKRPMPVRAVIMGGGFSPDDFAAVRSIPGGKSIPWLRPAHTSPDGKTAPPRGGPPSAEVIAARCKKGLEGKSELFMDDGRVQSWKDGEIWYF